MQDDNKPGWGKTIGMFFLCYMITIAICIIASASMVSQMGFTGYSNGGLMSLVISIGCAAYYRSTGKMAPAIVVSLVGGVAVGLLAVYLGAKMAGL